MATDESDTRRACQEKVRPAYEESDLQALYAAEINRVYPTGARKPSLSDYDGDNE